MRSSLAAVANGATVRGEPGVWTQYSERYYGAFVSDLHQNNVEAVWHAPEPVVDAPRRRRRSLIRRCTAHQRGSGFGPVAVTSRCGTQSSTWTKPRSALLVLDDVEAASAGRTSRG